MIKFLLKTVIICTILLVFSGLSLTPAFSQSDSTSICEQITQDTPIIVTTNKQNYDSHDDVIVSICMSPEIYHKHMEMIIYDEDETVVYQTFDPGFIWGESLEQEPYFFIQNVPLNSFEMSQKYTIKVTASGISGITYFEVGGNPSQDICKTISDDNPIVIATNNQYYEMGDKGIVYGCVSEKAHFKGININIETGDKIVVGGAVVPNENGFFSKEFVVDEEFDIGFSLVTADANQEFFADSDFVVSQRTQKSFFRTDNVESLIHDLKWSNSKPQDISTDDKTLLLSKFQEIAVLNLDDRQIRDITIPLDFETNSNIENPMFSKNKTNEIFFIFEDNLYSVNLDESNVKKLIENVEYFDLTSNGKIIFSNTGSSLDDELFSLWMSDLDGANKINLLDDKKDVGIFDISFDDSKLLFTKVTYDEPFVNQFLMIYDIETKQFSEIPELNIYCGPIPKWSPNNELIIYQYGSCDRHFPEASIYTYDLDGNSHFLTEVNHLSTDYLISNDGLFLYYNLAPHGVYQMTLAQPVPEFSQIVGFVLILTFLPIILLHKFNYLKLNIFN